MSAGLGFPESGSFLPPNTRLKGVNTPRGVGCRFGVKSVSFVAELEYNGPADRLRTPCRYTHPARSSGTEGCAHSHTFNFCVTARHPEHFLLERVGFLDFR